MLWTVPHHVHFTTGCVDVCCTRQDTRPKRVHTGCQPASSMGEAGGVCARGVRGGSGQQKSVRRRHRRQWRGTRRGRWGGGPSLRKAEEAGQRVLKQQHLRRNPEERDVYRAAARGDSRSPLKRHRRLCLLRILQRGKATAGKLKTSELHHTPSFQLAPLICGFDGSERTTVP